LSDIRIQMKQYFFAFCLTPATVLMLILLSGCGILRPGYHKDPAAVCEQFFYLLQQQEYEKAKKLGTERTGKILRVVQTLSEWGGGKNILRDNKKQLEGCEISCSEAVCTYETFTGPPQKVYLVKTRGRWLVDLRNE
jgi:hypothetical protein